MVAVDWTGLSLLAALMVGCVGYLAREIHRVEDRLRSEIVPRLDRLEERYVRHLELHAGR
jgi:hypothetical protein